MFVPVMSTSHNRIFFTHKNLYLYGYKLLSVQVTLSITEADKSTLAKGGKAPFRTGVTHHTRLFSAAPVSQRGYYCATFARHLSDSCSSLNLIMIIHYGDIMSIVFSKVMCHIFIMTFVIVVQTSYSFQCLVPIGITWLFIKRLCYL